MSGPETKPNRTGRMLCIGAAHWDVIARASGVVTSGDDVPGTAERRPGGVALNVAMALGHLGCPVSLCAVVGQDVPGRALLQTATACGVDCAPVFQIPGGATDTYTAIEDLHGDLIAAVADTRLMDGHVERVAARIDAALPEIDAIFVETNLPATMLGRIAQMVDAHGARLIANPVSPAKAARLSGVLGVASRLTIVANLAEAAVLAQQPFESAPEAASALLACGAKVALVTDGPRRAALASASGTFSATPPVLATGASVTGAGDALIAAFLAAPDRDTDLHAALNAALGAAADHMIRRTQR